MNDLVTGVTEFNLDEFATSTPQPVKYPLASLQNKAATLSLLSPGDDPKVKYEQLIQSAVNGDTSPIKQEQATLSTLTRQMDLNTAVSILSDKNESPANKQAAIRSLGSTRDEHTVLAENSIARPSKGESVDHGNARASIADYLIRDMQVRREKQDLINREAVKLNPEAGRAIAEAFELYVMPFAGNISVESLSRKLNPDDNYFKNFLRGLAQGSTKADIISAMEKMPPEARSAFQKKLVEAIGSERQIIFSSNSGFEKYDLLSTLMEDDAYGPFMKWMDNISPALDAVGLGQLIRSSRRIRSSKNAAKAATEATNRDLEVVLTDFEKKRLAKQEAAQKVIDAAPAPVKSEDVPVSGSSTSQSVLLGGTGRKEAPVKQKARLFQDPIQAVVDEKVADGISPERARVEALQEKLGRIDEAVDKIKKQDEQDALRISEERAAEARFRTTLNESNLSVEQKASILRRAKQQVNMESTTWLLEEADLSRRVALNAVRGVEAPMAPGSIAKVTNPGAARQFMAMAAIGDESVAQALFGTSRNDAIAVATMPQIGTATGRVTAQVPDILREVPNDLREMANESAGVHFTQREREIASARIVSDFRTASGISINDAESLFETSGNTVRIKASYTAGDGPWSDAQAAVDQTVYALRQYGVKPEDISILKLEGDTRIPVKLEEVGTEPGNYHVQVSMNHQMSVDDVGGLETNFDVKRNLFDSIPWFVWNRQGSVSRFLMDASSMLHPIFTKAAIVSTDASARFEKAMLSLADEFAKDYNKLSNARKAKLEEYFREANQKGIGFNIIDLQARQFSPEEISIVSKWRVFWDAHYYLENLDVVRSLNQEGFQLFKNVNFEGYAKPIAKNQNLGDIYDPVADAVVSHTKADGDLLYQSGGTYARLRRPISIAGVEVEHMIVPNTHQAYLRRVRDSDKVLNYREGYFQISYNAPRFVDVAVRGPNGNIKFWRAVGVAGDQKEAESWAKQYARSTGVSFDNDIKIRGDDRGLTKDSDSWWDVNSVNGRIAQRHRGAALYDASGLNYIGKASYIDNPFDSAVRAARNVANRTITRDIIETMKARFIQMYGDMIQDVEGMKRFPRTKADIGMKGEYTSKEVADARTTFEYINYLENGYINTADEVFKAAFNKMGLMLGGIGASKAERAAYQISQESVSGWAKRGVFTAYMALNPLRQWIVQPHQMIRTWAYNPKGWITGSMVTNMTTITGHLFGRVTPESTRLMKFVTESGMLDAVDMSNLVRGSLKDALPHNAVLRKAQKYGLDVPRKIGFDFAERGNLLGHLLSVYDRYKRIGMNLDDPAVRAEAYSEARALSYDMNFAGDMAYNQTWPSILLQFMQVPHKAILQLTNRRLPWETRARMAFFDMVMFGTPAATIAEFLDEDMLPEDATVREAVLWGMEGLMLNRAFSILAGEKVDIDISGLAPYDLTGWRKFLVDGLYAGGIENMILNSPAGQLYIKRDGKVMEALRSASYFFGIQDAPFDDPVTALHVAEKVLNLSSGWANWIKGGIELEIGQKVNKAGQVIDPNVNAWEAWATRLGFGTKHEKEYYAALMKETRDRKNFEKDIENMYKDIKTFYVKELSQEGGVANLEMIGKITGAALNHLKHNPDALEIFNRKLKQDLNDPNDMLVKLILKNIGVPDPGQVNDTINTAPISEEKKQYLRDQVKLIQQAREE